VAPACNGGRLSVEDFGDDLALTTIYQPIVLMPIVLNRFTALLIRPCYRKEAVRTRIIQLDEVEVSDILVS
jgi:hypothetical protein